MFNEAFDIKPRTVSQVMLWSGMENGVEWKKNFGMEDAQNEMEWKI